MISYEEKDIFSIARMTHKTNNSRPKIALYEPDIPQNTAAIARTCSCLGAILEIIEPCGFLLSDRRFKRVVMDYLDESMIKTYKSCEEFFNAKKNDRVILMTTKASKTYMDFRFKDGDTLLDLDVSSNIGEEYVPLMDDVTRMITLQVIIQLMLSLRDNNEYPFFSQTFFELLFYIVLGLMTYWLIIRKVIKIS